MKNIALVGYSGHAYVAYEAFFSQGVTVVGYTEKEEKEHNPYSLKYLGNERELEVVDSLKDYSYFVGVGDNTVRKNISEYLISKLGMPENNIHKTAIVSKSMNCGNGNLFAAGAIINPLVKIGNGVICNTGSIIEHECVIGDYVHVAPGAVLTGNVVIEDGAFIGANSVIKQGVTVGKNAIVGAGAVVINNVADEKVVVGNPAKIK